MEVFVKIRRVRLISLKEIQEGLPEYWSRCFHIGDVGFLLTEPGDDGLFKVRFPLADVWCNFEMVQEVTDAKY